MNRSLVFAIYNLLLPIVLVAGFPGFLIKGMRRGGLTRNFFQRLGRYRPETRERLSTAGNCWIHAVSVGEVLVALKIARRILAERPDLRIVLSTTTTTGFRLAEQEAEALRERVTVIHNPVDLPWIVRAALRLIRPERLILVEAEVWPNLVRQARGLGIPVVLVNARLSERSEKRFRACGILTRPVFSLLSRVGVPFGGDIGRWESLGIARDRIAVTGSVKFDEPAHASRPEEQIRGLRAWLDGCGVAPGSKILLAGSTHAGEEALIARAWRTLWERCPGLTLVVVPRHAERGREVAADLRAAGLNPVLKVPPAGSEAVGASLRDVANDAGGPVVCVANTTGELRAWFHLADIVVIGKSFIGHGGQNPIEPIAAGRPVIVGPNMENFRAIVADLRARDAIVQIAEGESLERAIGRLLDDPERVAALVRRGGEALESHRGATARTVAWILSPGAAGDDGTADR